MPPLLMPSMLLPSMKPPLMQLPVGGTKQLHPPTLTTNKTLIVKKVCRSAPDPFDFIFRILILACHFSFSSPADGESAVTRRTSCAGCLHARCRSRRCLRFHWCRSRRCCRSPLTSNAVNEVSQMHLRHVSSLLFNIEYSYRYRQQGGLGTDAIWCVLCLFC